GETAAGIEDAEAEALEGRVVRLGKAEKDLPAPELHRARDAENAAPGVEAVSGRGVDVDLLVAELIGEHRQILCLEEVGDDAGERGRVVILADDGRPVVEERDGADGADPDLELADRSRRRQMRDWRTGHWRQ